MEPTQESIPQVFRPVLVGTETIGHAVLLYPDLSSWRFTPEEKFFFCEELRGGLSLLAPTRIGKGKRHLITRLCSRYQMKVDTVRDWLSAYDRNYRLKNVGRESYFDEEGKACLVASIFCAQSENRPVNRNELQALLQESHEDTVARECEKQTKKINGKKPSATAQKVIASPSFLARFKRENMLTTRIPQSMTEARRRALRDLRGVFLVACCLKAYSGHLPAELKWNADSTTIEFKREGSGERVFIIHPRYNDSHNPITSINTPNELSLFVKWFHCANAMGHVAPMVVIVSCDGIPEDKFFAVEVKGLSNTLNGMSSGWLYFCHSRAGNAALWQHFFLKIIVPFLSEYRSALNLKDQNGDSLRLFFSTDGEAIILKEAFNEEVLTSFENGCIDYMKNGASLTSHQQPLDVASTFKSVKSGVAKQTRDHEVPESCFIRDSMKAAFESLQKEFSVTIPTDRKVKLIEALETLTSVLQGKWFDANKIRQGFIKCGHHVKNPEEHGGCTVSLTTVLKSVAQYKEISQEDLDIFLSKSDQVCQEFLDKGIASSEFLDRIGVPSDEDTIVRVELVIWRQTVQMVTKPHVVSNFRNYSLLKDPQQTEEVGVFREMCEAVKQMQRKKEAEAKKKETESLSKEEKAAQAKERKVANELKKRKREQEKEQEEKDLEQKFSAAVSFLGPEAVAAIEGTPGRVNKKIVQEVIKLKHLTPLPEVSTEASIFEEAYN